MTLGWRVHDSARGWINQVDAKIAAALAIEAVVLGFVVTLTSDSNIYASLTQLSRNVLAVGLISLGLSVVLSIWALMPRIKLREPPLAQRGSLYFGHLRAWDVNQLAIKLVRGHVDAMDLADQVIKMSSIAWRKHLLLKWSLALLVLGIFTVGIMYLLLILGVYSEYFGMLAAETTLLGDIPCR